MKSVQLLANKAYTSILGSLSGAASGSPTSNESSQLNAAPIAPGTTASFTGSAFKTRTGRVDVSALLTLSKNGGTLAAGDVVTFTLTRADIGVIGPQARVTATTAGADVIASASLEWVDNLAVAGTTYTYGITATIAGGHTGGILANEASVTTIDI